MTPNKLVDDVTVKAELNGLEFLLPFKKKLNAEGLHVQVTDVFEIVVTNPATNHFEVMSRMVAEESDIAKWLDDVLSVGFEEHYKTVEQVDDDFYDIQYDDDE